MARLIEVGDATSVFGTIQLEEGDVLLFKATGGRVAPDSGVVEVIGPFTEGFLQRDGTTISPAGIPNTVLFLARQPGQALIEVVMGDPFNKVSKVKLDVTVS